MTESNEIIKNLFDTLDDEKTGAQAKRGFKYQDWWCTEKIFSIWATENIKDFALGAEIKEDAVVIDSITHPQKLEFYQIKKRENKNWLLSDLYRVDTQKKSTLSKLYSRLLKFENSDIKLFFITNASLKAKHKNEEKERYHTNINLEIDLIDIDKQKIKKNIKSQLELINEEEIDLNSIYFKVTNLPLDDTDKYVYGSIYALNTEYKFPTTIKNIHVAANHITHIFNKISANTDYATDFSKLLSRCVTRNQLENIIKIIEKNFFDPEDILTKGIHKLAQESYPHRKLKKIELTSHEVLLDLRNRSKIDTHSLFATIDQYYLENDHILDELISFSSIVDKVSTDINALEKDGFFSIEYIKCAVIIYDISNGKIYCEKFFNI